MKGKDGQTPPTGREARASSSPRGSATIQIPGFEFDGERVIGAREAVSLRHVPKRLVVIGGGVIGLELGMVYQAFGSQLTVVELTPGLLPGTDPDCTKVVERKLKKRGARSSTNAKAEGVREERRTARCASRCDKGGETQSIECDAVLVAVGMKPRSRGIGLEAARRADRRSAASCRPTTCARPTSRASTPSAT